MSMTHWGRLALAMLLVLVPAADSALRAQNTGPVVLSLPASTEAMSLGDVFPVSGRDSDGLFYNPAALVQAQGMGIAAQRVGSGTLLTASGASSWLGGGVGLGVQSLSYDAASTETPPGDADLVGDGDTGVAELVGSVGYARTFGGVRLGAVGKVVDQRVGGASATAGAVDVGATTEVAFLTLGLAIQNIGSKLDLGSFESSLPDRVTLAGAFEPEPVGPLDIRGVAAVSRRTDGEIIPAAGVDVQFWPVRGRTFIGRLGLRRVPDGPAQPFSFGLAFWGDSVSIEYAFQAYDGGDDSHRLGLRWRQ